VALTAVMHAVPLQHPVGQVVESQTHWPEAQCSDAPQGALEPHRQPPFAQLSAFAMSQAPQAAPPVPQAATVPGDWHAPLASQQPALQEIESQTQVLLKHR
jgi:hypothetical protein